jgi:large subunit ribosomal protein L29
MSKAQELRDIGSVEREDILHTLRREIFELRGQRLDSKAQQKTHLIKQKRKKIARILTVKREQELKGGS